MKKLLGELGYGAGITLIGGLLIKLEVYPVGFVFISIGSLVISVITIAMGVNIGINSTKENNNKN